MARGYGKLLRLPNLRSSGPRCNMSCHVAKVSPSRQTTSNMVRDTRGAANVKNSNARFRNQHPEPDSRSKWPGSFASISNQIHRPTQHHSLRTPSPSSSSHISAARRILSPKLWQTPAPMAKITNFSNNSSSNHSQRKPSSMDVARRANIRASCYTVDAVTAALNGLHYSTTGVGGGMCTSLCHSHRYTDNWNLPVEWCP